VQPSIPHVQRSLAPDTLHTGSVPVLQRNAGPRNAGQLTFSGSVARTRKKNPANRCAISSVQLFLLCGDPACTCGGDPLGADIGEAFGDLKARRTAGVVVELPVTGLRFNPRKHVGRMSCSFRPSQECLAALPVSVMPAISCMLVKRTYREGTDFHKAIHTGTRAG
jgi:hypothetical protein